MLTRSQSFRKQAKVPKWIITWMPCNIMSNNYAIHQGLKTWCSAHEIHKQRQLPSALALHVLEKSCEQSCIFLLLGSAIHPKRWMPNRATRWKNTRYAHLRALFSREEASTQQDYIHCLLMGLFFVFLWMFLNTDDCKKAFWKTASQQVCVAAGLIRE